MDQQKRLLKNCFLFDGIKMIMLISLSIIILLNCSNNKHENNKLNTSAKPNLYHKQQRNLQKKNDFIRQQAIAQESLEEKKPINKSKPSKYFVTSKKRKSNVIKKQLEEFSNKMVEITIKNGLTLKGILLKINKENIIILDMEYNIESPVKILNINKVKRCLEKTFLVNPKNISKYLNRYMDIHTKGNTTLSGSAGLFLSKCILTSVNGNTINVSSNYGSYIIQRSLLRKIEVYY